MFSQLYPSMNCIRTNVSRLLSSLRRHNHCHSARQCSRFIRLHVKSNVHNSNQIASLATRSRSSKINQLDIGETNAFESNSETLDSKDKESSDFDSLIHRQNEHGGGIDCENTAIPVYVKEDDYGDFTSSYPHSAFEDDFLAGAVDENYLDDLVTSVKSRSEDEQTPEEKRNIQKIEVVTDYTNLPFPCYVFRASTNDNPYKRIYEQYLESESETINDVKPEISVALSNLENSMNSASEKATISAITQSVRNKGKPLDMNLSLTSKECEDQEKNVSRKWTPRRLFSILRKDLIKITPFPPLNSPSFCSYVNHSPMLQRLITLGIDLHNIEKDQTLAYAVFNLDLKRDVEPMMHFLTSLRIQDNEVPKLINSNPLILTEPIHDMETRIQYFASKKFNPEEVKKIMMETPLLLTTPVKMTDKMLGFIFKEFKFSPNQLRHIVATYPQVFHVKPKNILSINRCLRDCCDFTREEIRDILTKAPNILSMRSDYLQHNFETLTDELEIEPKQLLQHPAILSYSMDEMRRRIQLLKDLNRLQLDPAKENFVSMEMLCLKSQEFAKKVAKIPDERFRKYFFTQ